MSGILEIFFDSWTDLVIVAFILACCIFLGVQHVRRSRQTAARGTADPATNTSERLSDLGRGAKLGADTFVTAMVSHVITIAVISVVAFGILIALVLTPKQHYLWVGIASVPFVLLAGYVVFRSERMWLRKLRVLKS